MSRAARTVFVFALYLFVLGAVLLTIPNAFLGLFGIPPTTDVWVRVVGMLAVLLGYYYSSAARSDLTPFLRWTVHARSSVLVFFLVFAALGLAPPILVVFGVVDALAAGWTALALRADARRAG